MQKINKIPKLINKIHKSKRLAKICQAILGRLRQVLDQTINNKQIYLPRRKK